jgi:hypothetical protein
MQRCHQMIWRDTSWTENLTATYLNFPQAGHLLCQWYVFGEIILVKPAGSLGALYIAINRAIDHLLSCLAGCVQYCARIALLPTDRVKLGALRIAQLRPPRRRRSKKSGVLCRRRHPAQRLWARCCRRERPAGSAETQRRQPLAAMIGIIVCDRARSLPRPTWLGRYQRP